MPPWTVEQVLALAPDASSAKAGRGLAVPGRWSDTGVAGPPGLLWGSCRGSGKAPYQCAVDLSGPTFRCSCPSHKFPCKHAVGLLLLWAGGNVEPGEPAGWAAMWQAERAERAERSATRATRTARAAPSARGEQRAGRVERGLDELDRWLTDQVRTGLSGVEHQGYRHFDAVAARLVDAQAPALAGAVRGLAGVVAGGEGWPARLLEEYALLHLSVAAHRRIGDLPPDLAASVRARVGYPVSRADVLATAPVRDTWDVLGQRDGTEEHLRARRVWLRGRRGGRFALVLSFAAAGQALDATLAPGSSLDADLHFYPGAAPLRAIVGTRHGPPGSFAEPPGGGLAAALEGYARAVAADPWTPGWPAVVTGAVPVPPATPGGAWQLADGGGTALDVDPDRCDTWRLLAVSGGRPVTVAAECAAGLLRPFSVFDGGRVIGL